MPGAALLVALAVAGLSTRDAAAAEVGGPCAANKRASAGCDESCDAADARGSQSTMLIQFGVKHRKFNQPEEAQEGVKKVYRDSALARILKRAHALSEASGQPLDYLLDVDYMHDANNPLDNRGESSESSYHAEKEQEASSPPDQGGEAREPTQPKVRETLQATRPKDSVLHHPECVTRADPRVTASTFTDVAPPGTSCIFGLDERDEGAHCIMQGEDYGSRGWCYTAEDLSSWGSCSGGCPLSGAHALLEKRIDGMSELMDDLLDKVKNKTDCGASKKKTKGLNLLEKLRKAEGFQKRRAPE